MDRADYANQANAVCAETLPRQKALLRVFGRASKGIARRKEKLGEVRVLRRQRTLLAKLSKKSDRLMAGELRRLSAIAPGPGDEALVAAWIANRESVRRVSRRLTDLSLQAVGLSARLVKETDGDRKPRTKTLRRFFGLLSKLLGVGERLDELIRADSDVGAQLGTTRCSPTAAGGPAAASSR